VLKIYINIYYWIVDINENVKNRLKSLVRKLQIHGSTMNEFFIFFFLLKWVQFFI